MDYEARRAGCDFVVTTGDNFYTFGVSSLDDPQWRTSYENIYSPELRARPWFPLAGNHDWGGNIWAQLDRSGTGGWHMPWLWYDIPGSRLGRPDLHFFFVDTTVWRGREKKLYQMCGQSIRPEDIARQRTWLADALRASCAPTKIVFGHHPIYLADGRRFTDSLDDILIEANVTAYVCGHKHCLYHVKTRRLDYICSGGGSAERVEYRGPRADACVQDPDCRAQLERYIERAGFTVLEIGPESLDLTFVDRDGRSTPPVAIASRGNHALGCSGGRPVDPAVQLEHARARGTTYLPCTWFK